MMKRVARILALSAMSLLLLPGMALAHCDALDGPVVKAARTALAARDVTPVLRWVPADREAEISAAFTRTLAVRALGQPAQELADTWFFETLVRIHRAGEGAPYDGLKPAGQIEPVLVMGDGALDSGSATELVDHLMAGLRTELTERFQRARDAKARANDSVEAGRRYVAAYVEYLHYLEALHNAGKLEHGREGSTER
jgi:hypothetical protein